MMIQCKLQNWDSINSKICRRKVKEPILDSATPACGGRGEPLGPSPRPAVAPASQASHLKRIPRLDDKTMT